MGKIPSDRICGSWGKIAEAAFGDEECGDRGIDIG